MSCVLVVLWKRGAISECVHVKYALIVRTISLRLYLHSCSTFFFKFPLYISPTPSPFPPDRHFVILAIWAQMKFTNVPLQVGSA